jgi:hypothetical protein
MRRCLNAGALRQAYELCKAAHTHLFHYLTPEAFYPFLTAASIFSGLCNIKVRDVAMGSGTWTAQCI